MYIKQYRNIINCLAILLCAFTPKSFAAGAGTDDRRPATYTAADFVPTPRPFPSLLELSVKATAREAVTAGKSLKDALKEGKVPKDLVDLITGNTVTDKNRYLKIQALLIATPLIEAQMLGLLGKARHSLNVDEATAAAMEAWLNLVSTGKTIAATNTAPQQALLERLLFTELSNLYTSIPAITLLIYAGANPNTTNQNGETPLGIAAQGCSAEIARALLAANADPNISVGSREGLVPFLWWFVKYSHCGFRDFVRALLDGGANLNITDSSGQTLLHAAAERCGPGEITCALLDAGLNPNTEDSNGDTPLHAAVIMTNVETTRTLLARNADPNIKNKKGETPLGLAVRRGCAEYARALLAADADPNVLVSNENPVPLIVWAARLTTHHDRYTEVISALLAAGVNPNETDSNGQTPLHETGRDSVICMLLTAGADPNKTDSNGQTPLHAAAQKSYTSAVRILLTNSADPNITDRNGQTPEQVVPLDHAHSTIVAMLRKESKRRAAQSRTMQISAIIRKLLPSCSRPPNTE